MSNPITREVLVENLALTVIVIGKHAEDATREYRQSASLVAQLSIVKAVASGAVTGIVLLTKDFTPDHKIKVLDFLKSLEQELRKNIGPNFYELGNELQCKRMLVELLLETRKP